MKMRLIVRVPEGTQVSNSEWTDTTHYKVFEMDVPEALARLRATKNVVVIGAEFDDNALESE